MDNKMPLAALIACMGLSACLQSGDDTAPIIIDPVAIDFDVTPLFGASTGSAVPMLSADLGGVSSSQATIMFNANQTITIKLPNGVSVTVADADITDPFLANPDLGTVSQTYYVDVIGAEADADVHLGEDALGNDLFVLARVVEPGGTMAYVAYGNETATATASLPSGNVSYTGGFTSDIFDSTGNQTGVWFTGDTLVTANFETLRASVTLTDISGEVPSGIVFSTADLNINGAQYEGDLTSTGGGTGYNGTVIGAFYGPSAEATAGAFEAVDAGAGLGGTDLQVIGGFTGFRP